MIKRNTKIPILRISDDKNLFEDKKLLIEYINEHDKDITKRYIKFWNAYSCNSRILDTSLVPAKAMNKPDYRITVNYPRYVVDTYNGFARGIPVKFSTEDEAINEYVSEVWDSNELDDVNAEIHKSKCIFGESYQIVYVDENGDIGTVASDPLESFPIYNNSIKPKVRYFIRTYTDEDGDRHGTISDDTYVRYFDLKDGEIIFTEEHAHGFKDVPVVVYTMNSARIGLIEIILPMCDAYDKAISEKANDVDSFADAIMKVCGATLTESQIDDLRNKRIINIGGRDGSNVIIDFLSRPSGDTTQEHLLERLERLIFTVAMVCNVSDNNFATSSGIALKMKMTPMSNLASGDWRLDNSAMKQFWKLVFSNPVNTMSDEAWTTLKFTHYLNYPDDVMDSADVAIKLNGIVSKQTQLSILPPSIVSDVDAEIEQIEKEQSEAQAKALKQAAAQMAIQAQGQQPNTEEAEEDTEEETEDNAREGN